MRDVDPRSTFSRRFVLKATATIPAVAAATVAPLADAWAEGGTLQPATMKTLVKVARDIYPHDFLGDSVYITAVKPWDAKAAADPATKTMLEEGVKRLNQDAQDTHKSPYSDVGWESERVTLLQAIEHTDFFKKIRSDLVVSIYNQADIWPKFGYEGSSFEKGGYIYRGQDHHHWGYRVWNTRYNRYQYWDPTLRCYYYWNPYSNWYCNFFCYSNCFSTSTAAASTTSATPK